MKITQVMVEFEKRVNDGNYGSEKATAQYVAQVEDGEDPDDVIRQLVSRGRERVVGELKSSESVQVRWALSPPKRLCQECGEELPDEDQGYLHQACSDARTERYRRAEEESVSRLRQQHWSAPIDTGVDHDESDGVPENVPF